MKWLRRVILGAVTAAGLAACGPASVPAPPQAASKTLSGEERRQVSYMVGLDLAKNVAPVKDDVDIDVVVEALRAAYAGTPVMLDDAQAESLRKRFTAHLRDKREAANAALAAKNGSDGEIFLGHNAKRDGVITTASGLQYEVLRAAQGARPTSDDTVRINYIGSLLDGRRFEDTYAVNHPASFALKQVLPGLSEAIPLMPVGAKYRFWLPARLAYAERGLDDQIEPGSTLVFEVELLEIAAADTP